MDAMGVRPYRKVWTQSLLPVEKLFEVPYSSVG
jgi:hypothetical protein